MNNTYNIYLSGGMQKFGKEEYDKSNRWRKYCKQVLECVESGSTVIKVCNPNDYFNFVDETQYRSDREVMNLDLYKLKHSDLVIINFNDVYSLGSMAEIAIAFDRGIPIIGFNEDGKSLHPRVLHPWQKCMCERIFTDMHEMIDYIEDIYLR